MKKVRFELNGGREITVELYPEYAPLSVDNFIDLVKSGFYNGLCFHRVIPGFMVQGGGFYHRGGQLEHKDAPRTVRGEFTANGVLNQLSHKAGVLSMARTAVKDSASSQFFICVEDVPHLDGQYAAFGKTADESSLQTAIDIAECATGRLGMYDDVPRDPVVIERAVLVEE